MFLGSRKFFRTKSMNFTVLVARVRKANTTKVINLSEIVSPLPSLLLEEVSVVTLTVRIPNISRLLAQRSFFCTSITNLLNFIPGIMQKSDEANVQDR